MHNSHVKFYRYKVNYSFKCNKSGVILVLFCLIDPLGWFRKCSYILQLIFAKTYLCKKIKYINMCGLLWEKKPDHNPRIIKFQLMLEASEKFFQKITLDLVKILPVAKSLTIPFHQNQLIVYSLYFYQISIKICYKLSTCLASHQASILFYRVTTHKL